MKKPKLCRTDLQDLKRSGRQWMATCPQCGTHHLSVNLEKGLYHCFYAGCGFSGRLEPTGKRPPGPAEKQPDGEIPFRYLSHTFEDGCEIYRGGYAEQMERDADTLSYLNQLDQYS